MAWVKRAAWMAGGIILAVVVVVVVGAAWVDTAGGKAWLTAAINRYAGGQARIAAIGGNLPFHPVLSQIELLDSGGVWAVARDVEIDVAASNLLLHRRLTVRRLAVTSIDMKRSPIPAADSSAAQKPTAGVPSASLPKLPLAVELRSVSIATINLPADFMGEPTSWTMRGSARVANRDAALDLRVIELAAQPVRVEAAFDLSSGRIGASATVDDPRGLLLRRQLGDAQPLQLRIADDETAENRSPADWRGRLSGSIGDRATLNAKLRLAAEPAGLLFETNGTFAGEHLLPASLAPVIGDGLKFQLRGHEAEAGLTLDRLAAEAAGFRAEGSGAYRAPGELADVSLRVLFPDLAPYSTLAGQPLTGAADLTLSAEGPLDAWQAKLDLAGSGFAFGGHAVNEASAHVTAAATASSYQLNARGEMAGLRPGGAALPAHLGEALEWRLAAQSDASAEKFVITDATVQTAGLHVAGDGSFERASQTIAGTARVTAGELDRFSDLAGATLRGRGEIVATANGNFPGPVTVTVRGALDDFVTGIPAADALIGGKVQIDAVARGDERGRVTVENAGMRLSNVSLSARGDADPAANEIKGEFSATVGDLSVLRQAGLPAAGRLKVDGQVGGGFKRPAVDIQLEGTALAWQTARIDRATARFNVKADDVPRGTLNAELQSRDLKVNIAGEGSLSRDGKILTVPALRIRSGASAIEARLRTALDTFLTSGQVTVNIPDLTPWSPLAGMELGGRLNLKLALATQIGQSAAVDMTGSDLRATPAGSEAIIVGRIAANGTLTDLLRRPGGKIDARADGITAGGGQIREFRFSATSSRPDRFAFNGELDGNFRGPFALSTGGDVVFERGSTRATLARLTGRVAGTPLRLERPVTVTSRGPELSVADLVLAVGGGRIDGSTKLEATRLDVRLQAQRLPIGLAGRLAGREDISGALDARIDISGAAAQPRGRITMAGHELRAGPARRGSMPDLSFTADAALGPAHVEVNAAANMAATRLVTVTGTIPMRFGPQPGRAAIATDREMSVQARGEGELGALVDFLPLAGDRLAGHFKLVMDAAGTPATPLLSGNLAVDQGRYESLSSGLIVDALALDLGAERNRIVLRRLTATDGGKGMLDGSGSVSMPSGEIPLLDIVLNLRSFQALRRTDATLTASGSSTVNGPLTSPKLIARLAVDEAEIFIPDPAPPAARKIPVTVIDSSTGQVLQRPEEAQAATSGGIILDVEAHVPGRTFVRGRGLDSEWQGDVKIRGASSAPEITGALKVVKGGFSFFGRDMAISRGTVTFTGGQKIEPDLDVLAETTRSGAIFQVAVTGTPSELKIKLSSTPAMPEDEILSRMIFGREITKLTPAQGLQLAQAAATLSSGGPGMLDKVRRKLGLDVLNIGSTNDNDSLRPSQRTDSSGDSGGTANTGVSGGKYIADGVYVGAGQGLSGETRSKVEIEVLPNINVESTAGTRSESLGLNWKLDY